jgi:hypothetical protein
VFHDDMPASIAFFSTFRRRLNRLAAGLFEPIGTAAVQFALGDVGGAAARLLLIVVTAVFARDGSHHPPKL